MQGLTSTSSASQAAFKPSSASNLHSWKLKKRIPNGRHPLLHTSLRRVSIFPAAGADVGIVPNMVLPRFDPPGFLTDLRPENLQGWSDRFIQPVMESAKGIAPGDPPSRRKRQFFIPTLKPYATDVATETITWKAFPRQVLKKFGLESGPGAWARADSSRTEQDEYCEWGITKNAAGKITRIDFTCEGPEYWEYLHSVQPDTVLELYRKHVSPNVMAEDLVDKDTKRYVRANKWNGMGDEGYIGNTLRNTAGPGIMHLIQRANSLGAEIQLAADATVLRRDSRGQPVTEQSQLIACAEFGAPERFSDPKIGYRVNQLALKRAEVSLANPVGLYFDAFDSSPFKAPDGKDVSQWFTYTRGSNGHHVRAKFEVEPSAGYVVGDILKDNRRIRYGGQVVEAITIKLIGVAQNFGNIRVGPIACTGSPPAASAKTVAQDPTFNRGSFGRAMGGSSAGLAERAKVPPVA